MAEAFELDFASAASEFREKWRKRASEALRRKELGRTSNLYGTIATTGRCGNMHLTDVLHLRDLAHDCWQLADECVDHHSAGVLRRISEELKEKATDFEIRFAGQLREKFALVVDDPIVPPSTHN